MPITYHYTTTADKYSQLYRLQELLRIEHNKMGSKYKAGLISKIEFENWKNNYFDPRQEEISKEICILRFIIFHDDTITTSIGDITIE